MLFRIFWAFQTIFSKGILTILINKLIASHFGPQGLATFGYWQNFLTLSNGLSNGSMHNGIVLVASRSSSVETRSVLIKEFLLNSCYFILITAAGLLGMYVFGSFPENANQFLILSVVIGLLPIVSFSLSFSNMASGLKKHVVVGVGQLLSSLTILAGSYWSVQSQNLSVAIISLSLSFVPQLAFLLWHFRTEVKTAFGVVRQKSIQRELMHHGFATLVMLGSFPLANYLVRGHLIKTIGGHDAGMWEASLRLAGIVTAFMSFMNATYFLPSILRGDARHNRNLLLRFNGIQMALLGGLALSPLIPGLNLSTRLFSNEFSSIEALLPWIALMELIRGNQYFLTNIAIATARLKYLVGMELLFSLSLWIVVIAGLIPLTTQSLILWYTCLYSMSGLIHWTYLRIQRDI